MHIVGINLITFTAQIYNALHMQGKQGRLLSFWGSHGPFGSFKSAYTEHKKLEENFRSM